MVDDLSGGQHQVSDFAISRLDEHLASSLAPGGLLRYWAHWALSRLVWAVSNFPTADIDLFLNVVEPPAARLTSTASGSRTVSDWPNAPRDTPAAASWIR